jgi:hypothetical protein
MVTVPHETASPDTMPVALAARLALAGWVPAGRLGAGAHGPAWAVQRPDGPEGRAVVREVGVDVGLVEECADRLAALRGLANPHVARVLDVLDDGVGGPLVLVDEVPGPTLAALVGARGTLSPGEVVTVVVSVARGLAALHGAGLVHGDVAPSNVVIDPSGRPVLIDLWGTIGAEGDQGTAGFASASVLAGAPPRPADDLHALACLGLWALGDQRRGSGDSVAALLRNVRGSAAASRSMAAELDDRCHAAANPEPLQVPDAAALARAEILGGARTGRALLPTRRRPAPPGVADAIIRALGSVPRRPFAARRGPRRPDPTVGAVRGTRAAHRARGARSVVPSRAALAVVLGVGIVTLGGVGLENRARGADVQGVVPRQGEVGGELSATPGRTADRAAVGDAAAPGPGVPSDAADEPAGVPPEAEPDDPAAAARYLTGARAQVLISGDSSRLAEIDVPGSAAYEADRVVLVGLSGSVSGVDGLTCAADATVVTADATTAVVEVRYVLSAHTRRGPDGALIARVPATSSQTVRLTLGRTDRGWRVSDVAAAG